MRITFAKWTPRDTTTCRGAGSTRFHPLSPHPTNHFLACPKFFSRKENLDPSPPGPYGNLIQFHATYFSRTDMRAYWCTQHMALRTVQHTFRLSLVIDSVTLRSSSQFAVHCERVTLTNMKENFPKEFFQVGKERHFVSFCSWFFFLSWHFKEQRIQFSCIKTSWQESIRHSSSVIVPMSMGLTFFGFCGSQVFFALKRKIFFSLFFFFYTGRDRNCDWDSIQPSVARTVQLFIQEHRFT